MNFKIDGRSQRPKKKKLNIKYKFENFLNFAHVSRSSRGETELRGSHNHRAAKKQQETRNQKASLNLWWEWEMSVFEIIENMLEMEDSSTFDS